MPSSTALKAFVSCGFKDRAIERGPLLHLMAVSLAMLTSTLHRSRSQELVKQDQDPVRKQEDCKEDR